MSCIFAHWNYYYSESTVEEDPRKKWKISVGTWRISISRFPIRFLAFSHSCAKFKIQFKICALAHEITPRSSQPLKEWQVFKTELVAGQFSQWGISSYYRDLVGWPDSLSYVLLFLIGLNFQADVSSMKWTRPPRMILILSRCRSYSLYCICWTQEYKRMLALGLIALEVQDLSRGLSLQLQKTANTMRRRNSGNVMIPEQDINVETFRLDENSNP